MAIETKKKGPIGIELVRQGIVLESDISKAIEYQQTQAPKKKIGDILNILGIGDEERLVEAIGGILDERAILLTIADISISMTDYISLDIIKQSKAIPFEITAGKIKVCFADTTNKRSVETVRLLLLSKGLVMEKYITFENKIDRIIESMGGRATDNINATGNTTDLVDTIIKSAIQKRASDIHIEPSEQELRVRFRVDGELITIASIEKEKQSQVIGRLKAISNMHQEKQESQDGRILLYDDYNIRVSSQKNIHGEKFVLRLLKKNTAISSIFELGFPNDEELLKRCFNKRNSISIVAAPTGEGKTTTLYSIIDYLNRAEINITTIEDPVEIRIPGLNQIETDIKTTFSGSLRTVLRQDPDVILVGEIRDSETAEIAIQAGQTGHYVLSTIHTIDAIEVLTRLKKMGVSTYDIASTLATSVSQRLVRRVCPKCSKPGTLTDKEIEVIKVIGERYGVEFNFKDAKIVKAAGCKECDGTGYYERIGIFETLVLTDKIRDLIVKNASTIEIKLAALEEGYKPLVIDGIQKVLQGITTLEELDRKLAIF